MRIQQYSRLVKVRTCKFCGAPLEPLIDSYGPHDGGWTVDEVPYKVWLFITCRKCGYEWALWKLGVPREEKR